MDESRKITCLQTGCHPKALPASSARSRRVVRTEQAGEDVPLGAPGSAFGRPGMCLWVNSADAEGSSHRGNIELP